MAGNGKRITNDFHTIAGKMTGYVVVSIIHKPDGVNYPITSQSWSKQRADLDLLRPWRRGGYHQNRIAHS